jgi:hypothetical protein
MISISVKSKRVCVIPTENYGYEERELALQHMQANGSSHHIRSMVGGVLLLCTYADCRQKKSFRTNISAALPVIFLLHQ